MKTLFKRIGALGLLLAALTAPGIVLANDAAPTVQQPAPIQLAWDRVGSPIQTVV